MEPDFPRLEQPLPLHKTVQKEIRNYIISRGLRAGDALKPEAELARLFGVSRNSVREAVKALESMGVLETRRGSGVFVRGFSFTPLLDNLPYGLLQDYDCRSLVELVELRKVLETSLITDVMTVLSEENIESMREVLDSMRQRAERGEPVSEQDRQFHNLLFADLGNAMLLQLFEVFWMAFHRAAPQADSETPMEAYRAHMKILEAVLSGDPGRAQESMREHYTSIQKRLRS